jgi:hypothetical protein
MIFYNSLLAKWFLGKGKKHYFMLGWFFFTRYKYLEVWEDMELRIHARQYWECFSLTLIPALILSLLFSWWWMVLPFVTYHILYWFEKIICHHSIFNWEAMKHCGDTLYLRKRKAYAWKKGYGKKELPASRWNEPETKDLPSVRKATPFRAWMNRKTKDKIVQLVSDTRGKNCGN